MSFPIADLQTQFLIQADFDTSANRQDVTTSRRNMGLLVAIADAFVKATLQFCEHRILCYMWPMFLPSETDSFSSMWMDVVRNIKTKLSRTPILKARHSQELRRIDKVVTLVPAFQDHNAEPLLDSEAKDPFLSGVYPPECIQALQQYGLGVQKTSLLFELLELDLQSLRSRMKSYSTSADWHSRVARVLLKYGPGQQTRFRELDLLPLRNGGLFGATNRFVSANYGQVYLPTSEGIPIPRCADLSVLDATAVANEDRKTLFVQLGAVEASAADARAKVLLSPALSEKSVTVESSREALHFLYLTHKPSNARSELRDIFICSADGLVMKPHQEDVYLRSTHPYGPEALFGSDHGVSGFRIAFAHPRYLEDVSTSTNPNHPPWRRWLYDYVGIRERLRLLSQDESNLSDAWIHVVQHLPEKALGLLEYLWKYEGKKIATCSALKAMIAKTNARELCGDKLLLPCALQETYIPFPSLRQLCKHYMEQQEQFPFLLLEDLESTEALSIKWMFLNTNFGVGKDDDWKFLVNILRWIKNSNPKASSVRRQQRVMDLYVAIDTKCTADFQRADLSRSTL